jgi:hypothetical protein
MAVYEWSRSERYAGYVGVTDADERKLNWSDALIGDPLPPLSAWLPPCLAQYEGAGRPKRKPKPIGDSPASGRLNLISERAAEALADIWQRHAILYPVSLDDTDQRYYMVVVKTTIVDALDREASSGKRNTHGGDLSHFATLDEWVFKERRLQGVDLFQVPDIKLAYYVTDAFKQRVIQARLKGFCLKARFWDDKPFLS